MFSNDESSRQNARSKVPKIDIDLDTFSSLSSFFFFRSNSVKSSCENCNVKFGLMRGKKICRSCKYEFCVNCFRIETDLGDSRSTICLKCRVFSQDSLKHEDLNKLKVRDLKWFLKSRRISFNFCKEKSDLVDLIIQNFGLKDTNQTNQSESSRKPFEDASTSEQSENISNFKNFNIEDVKNEEEIKNLSVRQLKLILTRNYVNYKGCCEIEELQNKAIRLWNQIKQNKDSIDETKDEDICKICMENVINCVFLECGHLVTCIDCGKCLNECPICRQCILRVLRTFKS